MKLRDTTRSMAFRGRLRDDVVLLTLAAQFNGVQGEAA